MIVKSVIILSVFSLFNKCNRRAEQSTLWDSELAGKLQSATVVHQAQVAANQQGRINPL